jgi:hypothetical protein
LLAPSVVTQQAGLARLSVRRSERHSGPPLLEKPPLTRGFRFWSEKEQRLQGTAVGTKASTARESRFTLERSLVRNQPRPLPMGSGAGFLPGRRPGSSETSRAQSQGRPHAAFLDMGRWTQGQ